MSEKCTNCNGEGRIANSDDGEPWSLWEKLPPGADVAVKLGLVRPIDCPSCGGTGRKRSENLIGDRRLEHLVGDRRAGFRQVIGDLFDRVEESEDGKAKE